MAKEAYESDITKMMRALLDEKPHIIQEQKKGRALWWDRKFNLDRFKRAEDSNIHQQPYVYQTKD